VSLSEADLAVLDGYARDVGLPSRSAAVQHAIRLLRHVDLDRAYADAYTEWEGSPAHAEWEVAVGDGVVDAPR